MEMPSARPEGALLRLARDAAGISIPEAVRRSGVSKARWSQVESGTETRNGVTRPVQAKAGTLARMARAVGITPERLESEGQRPDAAKVLREILAQDAAAPVAAAPSPAEDFARQMGVDPSDPDDPWLRSVRRDIAAAVMAHGAGATGAQVFRGHPGSDIEAMLWDAPGLSQEGKEQAIAAMRADRARYEASRPGDASGTAGLGRRAAALAAR